MHHPQVQKIDEIELFRTFKKYDRNMNGTLELPEYTQCLAEAPDMELTKQEIITLALSADLDGDGKIDFEEFMAEAPKTLRTNLIKLAKTNGNDLGFLS